MDLNFYAKQLGFLLCGQFGGTEDQPCKTNVLRRSSCQVQDVGKEPGDLLI